MNKLLNDLATFLETKRNFNSGRHGEYEMGNLILYFVLKVTAYYIVSRSNPPLRERL